MYEESREKNYEAQAISQCLHFKSVHWSGMKFIILSRIWRIRSCVYVSSYHPEWRVATLTRTEQSRKLMLLPPAYVVRREGNSSTLFVSSPLGGGGYPYPIMLCNISQNAMGQLGGGYPYPIMLCNISQNAMGQLGVPCQVQLGGVPWQGGPYWGGTLAMGVPWPGGVPWRGGTQLGQHREYLLHGGRYASCVHAGGLSC